MVSPKGPRSRSIAMNAGITERALMEWHAAFLDRIFSPCPRKTDITDERFSVHGKEGRKK
jgi:hypothetical protein